MSALKSHKYCYWRTCVCILSLFSVIYTSIFGMFTGMVIPAIFLVLTGYMDCHHQVEAVILLSLSMGFCGFQFSSFFINHGDIAPRYAGTVFGFTNTGASIPGMLAPYIVGAITPNVSINKCCYSLHFRKPNYLNPLAYHSE